MTHRIRVVAETSPWNPWERFGREARKLEDYLLEAEEGMVEVTAPWDEPLRVSLRPVAAEDPRLYLEILFLAVPAGEDFGSAHMGATILDEFDLPPGAVLPT